MSPKILYIEDDEAIVNVVQNALTRKGYHVVSTETAREGLHVAADMRPDLILIDLWLPDNMDGYEAARLLRDDAALGNTPLIAVSAQSSAQAQRDAREAGFDAYIVKPFRVGELLACIEEFIG